MGDGSCEDDKDEEEEDAGDRSEVRLSVVLVVV
jgi:hypothetical protein